MKRSVDTSLLKDSLRTQLWPAPLLAVVVSVTLGQYLPFLDGLIDEDLPSTVSGLLFGGGPEAARSLLETIASSMITVTSLTFSLTVVTLQLASSQFSPRLLRTFTRDRFVHNTLALFLATFTFALTVLRSVRVETSEGEGFVPVISVTVAFLLTLGSVVGLVLFLAHLAQQIRVETMLRDVHREADNALTQIFSDDNEPARPPIGLGAGETLIENSTSGFLLRLDPDAALTTAKDTGTFIVVDVMPGASLVKGVPFARAWSLDGGSVDAERRKAISKGLNSGVATGFERTSTQDAGFGLQQLLDVASRALSPGINDPTTAIHALSHVASVLCGLAGRKTGPKILQDDDGVGRVVLQYPTFPYLLNLAMEQMLEYGMSDPRMAARIVQMLREVAWVHDSAEARSAVIEQLSRTRTAADESNLDSHVKEKLAAEFAAVEAALGSAWPVGGAPISGTGVTES
ncbi:DUF2254 domain-containing protein [Arthrobacter sp. H41]|uniref:DUF2254 domain-containing protein n=1 Tax=Arthrobacter sp. H41 TaxID=1312978 RepID=UPI0004B03235|nr:DUF2254 domain-containing protein [Arthrobacter sp. H41]